MSPVLQEVNSHMLKIEGDFQRVEKIKLGTFSSNMVLAQRDPQTK